LPRARPCSSSSRVGTRTTSPGGYSPLRTGTAAKPSTPAAKPTAKPAGKTYLDLKRGPTGADVVAVARTLRKEGYNRQGDTRMVTAQLETNIRDYQRRLHLIIDGVAGEKTQKLLGL
jgi:peptidoglycan hydrolase-like protein with peptidoglycan-binding domain